MCFKLSKGYKKYSSTEAHKKYADSLVVLSDKVFSLTVVPPSVWAIEKDLELLSKNFAVICLLSLVTLCIGLYLRNAGLSIYDEISNPGNPDETK